MMYDVIPIFPFFSARHGLTNCESGRGKWMFKKSKSSHRFLRQRQEDDNNRGVVFKRLMLYKPIAHLHSISSRKRHATKWDVILLATWFSFKQPYLLIIQNAKFSSQNCWVLSILKIGICFHCKKEGNLLGVIVKKIPLEDREFPFSYICSLLINAQSIRKQNGVKLQILTW